MTECLRKQIWTVKYKLVKKLRFYSVVETSFRRQVICWSLDFFFPSPLAWRTCLTCSMHFLHWSVLPGEIPGTQDPGEELISIIIWYKSSSFDAIFNWCNLLYYLLKDWRVWKRGAERRDILSRCDGHLWTQINISDQCWLRDWWLSGVNQWGVWQTLYMVWSVQGFSACTNT